MPSWACCGENRVFSFRRGCRFKYAILEGMALSFCQSVNNGYGKGKKIGGSRNLVGVSIYFSYSKQEELSVCYSM